MKRNEVVCVDWHRADIVAAIHKRGKTMRDLSIGAGLSADTLKNALSRKYPKAEGIIAEAIGEEPATIWPSRYNKQQQQKVA
ncbi:MULTISPECIES: helix-turn-helix domain-containing protein [Serratia]|uniref:helix-turn-helix domain-containing protein n=1 Tax=Serratia TaxID=613 RepID=UPI0027E58B49|nr:helix-turn-helix domain-containing protein [Serratia marcescens]MCH4195251.1 helix-turn-helix domain-containing protein [Serratia liquefaciens]MCH4231441.1 helix-turn-helix domain-containing protein [Serratia liquefaciens]MCH4263155.1 helix-turn-helix domain-containing protein [Serratia liquefaciens]MCI1213190.1 helix-turn-helix domain-containing protein [Serratia liquefaciens]MCI1234547.1 helix-turn-helix domain-containing protein [Serratia liquefaciens]